LNDRARLEVVPCFAAPMVYDKPECAVNNSRRGSLRMKTYSRGREHRD
jgi:hypothetical protein